MLKKILYTTAAFHLLELLHSKDIIDKRFKIVCQTNLIFYLLYAYSTE
uniref:Uncharacterized protein n=1 Tax=Abalone asfa-like virus TaxID=2839893 RepID=A0A5K7Y340_9VIRU|nr:hypothetical protein [Abalone asfa-like virus]